VKGEKDLVRRFLEEVKKTIEEIENG